MPLQHASLLAHCVRSFRLYAFANSRNTERQGWPQATAKRLGLDTTYALRSAPPKPDYFVARGVPQHAYPAALSIALFLSFRLQALARSRSKKRLGWLQVTGFCPVAFSTGEIQGRLQIVRKSSSFETSPSGCALCSFRKSKKKLETAVAAAMIFAMDAAVL